MSLSIEPFVGLLRDEGVEAFTGVPCSYFKSFVSYAATSERVPYTAAASEGEAVAIAAGSYLAGRLAAVLIQNSGLGNGVNPITSLVRTYDIPLLLMVSHRGEGGADAPQHHVMGAITHGLLETMGVETETLPSDPASAEPLVRRLLGLARDEQRAVALVVPKGTFAPFDETDADRRTEEPAAVAEATSPCDGPLPSRLDALRAVDGALRETDLVVSTTGMTSRELFSVRDRPANFYMMGSMGCAPGLALGVLRARPHRKLVLLDGDGAFLMKMGTAATIGHYRPPGLLHVLLDNGTYETTGGQPTVSPSVAFERVAAACGYRRAFVAGGVDELAEEVARLSPGDGPVFCALRIADGHLDGVGRVGRTPRQIRDAFVRAARHELV